MSVPVLSLSRYSILPSSSGSVLVLTIVPGISGSFMIWEAYTVFPMSRFTRKLSKSGLSKINVKPERLEREPDWDDRRKQDQKPENIYIPQTTESVESDKHER